MLIDIQPTDGLLVVDMQNDFMPNGALAVKDGHIIVPIVNKLLFNFDHRVFSRDWHPANHISFSSQPTFTDGSWPPHCIQNTSGAAFHPDLNIELADLIINKAENQNEEAYSAFQHTTLNDWLLKHAIKRLFIVGLATDYCVKHSALDAAKYFETWVIGDAIKGVDVPAGSVETAIQEMESQHIHFISSKQLVRP